MATVYPFPRPKHSPELRLRGPRRRRLYVTTGREQPVPRGLWWFVDLFPAPRICQPHAYRRPGVVAKIVVAFVVMLVIGFVLGAALTLAPNGDLYRPVLNAIRK